MSYKYRIDPGTGRLNDPRLYKGGDSGSYYDNAERLYGVQADTAQFMLDIGKGQLPGAVSNYAEAAAEYNSPEFADRMAGKANLDAQQAIGQNTAAMNRNMARYGINPASGKFAGMANQNAVSNAALQAGASNSARNYIQDKKFGVNKDFYSSLVGMSSDAASQAGQAGGNFASIGGQKANQQASEDAAWGSAIGMGAAMFKDGGEVSIADRIYLAFRGGKDDAKRRADLAEGAIGDGKVKQAAKALKSRQQQIDDELKKQLGYASGGEVKIGRKMASGGLFGASSMAAPPPPTGGAPAPSAPSSMMGGYQTGNKIKSSMAGPHQGIANMASMGNVQGAGMAGAKAGLGGNTATAGLAAQDAAMGEAALGGMSESTAASMLGSETAATLAAQDAAVTGTAGLAAETTAALGAAETAAAGTAGMTGALGAVATAVPWVAAGAAIGSMLGLFADGGEVREDMIAGGDVDGPGGETDDKIPAWLSDGEFVVNAESVKMPGVKRALQKINAAGLAKRYGVMG